jgi:molybdopterin/thiamine biosynthesis adenylyltransferase
MFSYVPGFIPPDIFVIGAGGTGSRLMPMLSQFIRSITRGRAPNGWLENPTIWLIDDDTVEQKNLLRQNFIATDVGKHKAAVVAERYSRAYDVNIVPITSRITTATASEFHTQIAENINVRNNNGNQIGIREVSDIMRSSIVIICVDSAEARRDILNVFIRPRNDNSPPNRTIFIDAGNEDSFGQVSFFTPDILNFSENYTNRSESDKVPKLIPFVIPLDFVPMDVNYYINLVDTESTASCADLNQTLAINALMATNIMGLVQNFYYRKPMTFNCLRTSLDGGNSTDYNTFRNFFNKSIPGQRSNTVNSKEKNGSVKKLSFLSYVNYTELSTVANTIMTKIEEERRIAQEAIAALERQKALEEKISRLQETRELAKQRFEAKLRRDREAAAAAAIAANVAPIEVPIVVPEVVVGIPDVAVAPVVIEVNTPPPLVRTARSRTRTVVELALPEVIPESEDSTDSLVEAEEVEEN